LPFCFYRSVLSVRDTKDKKQHRNNTVKFQEQKLLPGDFVAFTVKTSSVQHQICKNVDLKPAACLRLQVKV
jgi:hypothetical protein